MKKILIVTGMLILFCASALGIWVYAQANNGYVVNIYRFNTRTNTLEPERRIVPEGYTEEMVQTVVNKLYELPRSTGLQNTIPGDLLINQIRIIGDVMEISFSYPYFDMAPHEEGLFRASLVQTMRSLPFINIEGVLILVDGEEIVDPFGMPLGVIRDEQVLISPPIMPRRTFEQTIILYFVSADIDGLLPEERVVERIAGVPVEHNIIEALIEGPAWEGRISSIAEGTSILGVLTEEGLCSINLSAEFTDNFRGSQTLAELTLRSIVQSIMENQNNVSSIQFLIESERRESFNGVPYFDTLFERDEAG